MVMYYFLLDGAVLQNEVLHIIFFCLSSREKFTLYTTHRRDNVKLDHAFVVFCTLFEL